MQGEGRHQTGVLLIDIILGRCIAKQGGNHGRVVLFGDLTGKVHRCLRQLQRLRFHQLVGQFAHHLAIGRPCGFEIAGRSLALGFGGGKRSFGLGHVSAGDFTNAEAVVGGFQLAGQNPFVVDIQVQGALGLDHLDIGVHRVLEGGLFGGQQGRALRHDLVFRLVGAGTCRTTAEQGLVDRQLRRISAAVAGIGDAAIDPIRPV